MRDVSQNTPAVLRRVSLFVILTAIFLLGAKVRSAYAINPLPVIGEPRSEAPASYDQPVQPPMWAIGESPQAASKDLPFPAFKLPFPAGDGYIPRDGGYTNGWLHIRGNYDQFAIDMCEGSSCEYGQHVVAPTNITYDNSSTWSNGYHFFEVHDDGSEKLCMSLGHFDWPRSVFPSGLPTQGTLFPQGAVLGEVSWWGGMPHVHIGIWKMPSKTPEGYPARCHYSIVPRQPQPFTGIYQIDGIDLEACWPDQNDCYNVHSGRQLVSTNAAYSFSEMENPALILGPVHARSAGKDVVEHISPAKTGGTAGIMLEVEQTATVHLPVIRLS